MYEKIFQLQEEVFKVLANQKRLEIIQLLSHNELCVSEMIEMLGLPQANLSQHLSLMRRAGLLKIAREGTKIFYKLSDPQIAELVFNVRDFLIHHEQLDEETRQYFDQPSQLYPLVRDVVCGMRLSTVRSPYQSTYEGRTYSFCASGCYDKFEANPTHYAAKKAKVEEAIS